MKHANPYNYLNGEHILETVLPAESNRTIYSVLSIVHKPIADFPYITIDLRELYKSKIKSGDFFILTCECGSPECKGISKGVKVTHHESYVSWNIEQPEPMRVYNFKKDQYTTFIDSFLTDFKSIFEKYRNELLNQKIKVALRIDYFDWKFLKQ